MELHVFLAVLAAAAMHASWNAFVKGGGDPFATLAQMSCVGGSIALVGIWFVVWPAGPVWPWLAASWVLHAAYRAFLTLTYKAGDLSHVYPIARGAAPLMTTIAATAFLDEQLRTTAYLGIMALVGGVLLLSLKGGRGAGLEPRAVGFALLTACSISGYTIIDGYGSRLNGSAVSFIFWESLGNAVIMAVSTVWLRGWRIYLSPPQPWPHAIAAASLSTLSYLIAAWAMTKAPIALVAALRETSVLFAALIAIVFLGEPVTRWRIGAGLMVVLGVVLMRMA